ncbi:MAG: hypothetical protein Mars2KO_05170 [Maribacter sp.]
MLRTKKYRANGQEVSLIESDTLFVVRTEEGYHPASVLQVCLKNDTCEIHDEVDGYPEANVWVYRLAKDSSFTVNSLKLAVRAQNHPGLVFIGSVYKDLETKRYQLYTGNLFVRFVAAKSEQECMQLLSEMHLKLKLKLGFTPNSFFVEPTEEQNTQFQNFQDAFEWAAYLNGLPEVFSCQPELVVKRKNLKYSEQKAILDPDRNWIANKINLKKAWKFTKGQGVKICIIDDGIDPDHPGFAGAKIIFSKDMLLDDNGAARHQFNSEKHGTACASIAASSDYRAWGVAPEADLIIVRCKGLGSVLEAEAIYWAVKQGADIISCSWGPSDGEIDDPFDDFPSHRLPEHTKLALEYAAKNGRNGKGCPIFFAAGNGNEAVDLDSYASSENVMAIGAVNKRDRLSVYSDKGFPLFCVFPSSDLVKMDGRYKTLYGVTVADRIGMDGYSDADYFSLFGGTSASAPGMAGVAALALGENPNLAIVQLRELLASSCKKIGSRTDYNVHGYSEKYGYGLIDALEVVKKSNTIISKNSKKMNSSPKGFALHIGVDETDPAVYSSFPTLLGCVNDSEAISTITKREEFDSIKFLHNEEATRDAILEAMNNLASDSSPGDLVVMSYAGHGSYIVDRNGDEPKDQVLVTYDGFLVDDEINEVILKFKLGVRVVWISDACHSESNLRAILQEEPVSGGRFRELPPAIAQKHYKKNKSKYDSARASLSRNQLSISKASVFALYACQKTELAQEVSGRGLFSSKVESLYFNDNTLSQKEALNELSKPLSKTQNPVIEFKGNNEELFNKGLFKIGSKSAIPDTNDTKEENPTPYKPVLKKEGIKIIVESESKKIGINNSSRSGTPKYESRSIIESELDYEPLEGQTPWDQAYDVYERLENKDEIDFIEPDIESELFRPDEISGSRGETVNKYLSSYPDPTKREMANPFIWHLDEKYSQLRKAFEVIQHSTPENLSEEEYLKLPIICHIDTGVDLRHPSLPKNYEPKYSKNFQKNTFNVQDNDTDWKDGVIIENQWHGTGTVAILAGNRVSQPNGSENKKYYGAFPYARVVTIKISESVVLLSGHRFAKALRYAVDVVKCDVVTMSMAGAPTRRMMKAVNHAYDKGVVVVSAGGNSWTEGPRTNLPKTLMYPARFNRVIAVTGVTPDFTPYLVLENRDHEDRNTRDTGGIHMQTCYGPELAMRTAIAAYTPNVMWAGRYKHGEDFDKAGGGTSSATPQVAAAAAMWMYHHRDELNDVTNGERDWRRVELTRQALFLSAEESKIRRFNEVFGNGMLKAYDSLGLNPKKVLNKLKKEEKDTLGFLAVDNLFRMFFPKKEDKSDHEILRKMLQTEVAQLCLIDPAFEHIDDKSPLEELAEAVAKSEMVSNKLRKLMARMVDMPALGNSRSSIASPEKMFISCGIPHEEANEYRVHAENCAFRLEKTTFNYNPDTELAAYELIVEDSVSRGFDKAAITISIPEKGARNSVAFLEWDEEQQIQKYYWVIPEKPSDRGTNTFLDFNQSDFTIDIPTEQTRGLKKIKCFFIKVFRTITNKPLTDRPGLQVAKIENGSFEWVGNFQDFAEQSKLQNQKKTLFLMHGTFSSTVGSFGDLMNNTGFLNDLVTEGFGKYVLAYNMSTIRSSIADNAQELKKIGITKIKKTNPYIIASSRGCLVAREFFGNTVPMALVAGTHWGTPLASPENLGKYFNRVSNLASLAFGGGTALAMVLKGVALAVNLVLKAKGIKDQEEDGKYVNQLNENYPLNAKQLLIGSNYEPDEKAWKVLADEGVDRLIFKGRNNDGVTLTASALGYLEGNVNGLLGSHQPSLELIDGSTNHFTFFRNPEVLRAILNHFK